MLSVKLLGEHYLRRASGEDVSAAIHYRKGWALLGYLAVEKGRRHSREDLAQLLWPHLPAGAARTNLRQVVADLNRVFDSAEGLLEVNRESIGLFPVAQVDIDLFALDMANREIVDRPDAESLLRAEQRCRHLGGEFLAGFELDECDEFTEWLQLTRQRLAGLTANALQHLCEQQETAGWLPQAIATARRLTVLDEWNEGHQRRLMGLLAANGQHQQALVAFEVL
ncbi:MAG TPA: BTAD domain-containing putative transcriptional regulator, partial [Lysobacter sp.]|nr:BTAD domain-containing putative transcriptional regulator [Lysobacter sp.]